MSLGEPIVEVHALEAGYVAGRPAISELEFSVRAGELLSVLGPNGGGKTTLFRALLGEVPFRRGEVVLRGDLAYVPQTERSRLDFPVNALDVALMGAYARVPWHRRIGGRERAAAREALASVGLADRERTSYGALSGGQRQRVLIARALAQEASVVLLDEPLSGLDQRASERVTAVLEQLRSAGRAILVATHDIRQAGAFDRVLCVNRTQVAWGDPTAVLTAEALRRTYGSELVFLPGGEPAAVVQHHAH